MAKVTVSVVYGKYEKQPHSNRYIFDTWYTFVTPTNNDTTFGFDNDKGFINITTPGRAGYIYPHGFGKNELIFGVKIGVNNYDEIGIVFDYVNKDNYYYYSFTPDRVLFGRYIDGKNEVLFTRLYPHPSFDYHTLMVKVKNGVVTLFETDGWFYFDTVYEYKLNHDITGSYGFFVANTDHSEIVEVTEYNVVPLGVTKEIDIVNGQEYDITKLLEQEVINYCNNNNIDYESVFYIESTITSLDKNFDIVFSNGTNYTSQNVVSILLIPRTKIVLDQPQVSIEVLSATKAKITFKPVEFADEYVLTDMLYNTIAILDASKTEYIIENLQPSTPYTFYLTARSLVGFTSNPAEIQFITKPAPEYIPNQPQLITVIDYSMDSVTYAWERIPDVDGYIIQDENGNVIAILQPDTAQYTETGLLSGQTITRYVIAYNLAGYSEPSQAFVFTVPDEIEIVDVVPVSKFYGVPIASNAIRWEWEYSQLCNSFIITDENDNILTIVAGDKRAYTEINLQQSKEYTRRIIAVFNGIQSAYIESKCTTLSYTDQNVSTVFEYKPIDKGNIDKQKFKTGIGDLDDIKGSVSYIPLDTFDIKVKYIPRKFATPLPDYDGEESLPQYIDGIIIDKAEGIDITTGYGQGYGSGYGLGYGSGYGGYDYGSGYSSGYGYGYGYGYGFGYGYGYGGYGYGYSYGYGGRSYGGYYGWLSGGYYGNWYGALYRSSYSSYGWLFGGGSSGGRYGGWNFTWGLGGSWVGGYIYDINYWKYFRGQPSYSGISIIDNTTGKDISNKIYYYPRIDFEYKIDITEYKRVEQRDGYITKAEVIEYPQGEIDIEARAYKDVPIEVKYKYDVKFTLGKGHEPRPPAFDYREVIVQVPENSLPVIEEYLYANVELTEVYKMYFDIDLTLTINAKITPIESRKENIKVLLVTTKSYQNTLSKLYKALYSTDERIRRKIYLTAVQPADTIGGQYKILYENVELNDTILDSLKNLRWNNIWYQTFIDLINNYLISLISQYKPDVLIIADNYLNSMYDKYLLDDRLTVLKTAIITSNILLIYDNTYTDKLYTLNKIVQLCKDTAGYYGHIWFTYSDGEPNRYLVRLLYNVDYTPFEYKGIFRLPCYVDDNLATIEKDWGSYDTVKVLENTYGAYNELIRQLNDKGIIYFKDISKVLKTKLNNVSLIPGQEEIVDGIKRSYLPKVIEKTVYHDPVLGGYHYEYHIDFVKQLDGFPVYIRVFPVFKTRMFSVKTQLKVNLNDIERTYFYKPWRVNVNVAKDPIEYEPFDLDKTYTIKSIWHSPIISEIVLDKNEYNALTNKIENMYMIKLYTHWVIPTNMTIKGYPNIVGDLAYSYYYTTDDLYNVKCCLFVYRTDFSVKTKLYDHRTYNNYFTDDKCDVNSSIEIQFGLQPDSGYTLVDRFIYTVPWTEDDGKEYGHGVIIEGTEPNEDGLYTKYLARLTYYAYSNENPQVYTFSSYSDGIRYKILLSYPDGIGHDQKFMMLNPFTIEEIFVAKYIEQKQTGVRIENFKDISVFLVKPVETDYTAFTGADCIAIESAYGALEYHLTRRTVPRLYQATTNTIDPGKTIYVTKSEESFTFSSMSNPMFVKQINYQTDFAQDIANVLANNSDFKEITSIDIVNIVATAPDIYPDSLEFSFEKRNISADGCEIWCYGYLNTAYYDSRSISGIIYNYEGESEIDCSVLKPARFDGEYTGDDVIYELVVRRKSDNVKVVVLPDNIEITEPGTYTVTKDTKVVVYNTESYLIDILENIYLPPNFVFTKAYTTNKEKSILMFRVLKDEEDNLLADNIKAKWSYNLDWPYEDYHYMSETLRSIMGARTLYITPGIKIYSIPINSTTDWVPVHVNGAKPILYNYDGYESFTVILAPYLTYINNPFDIHVYIRNESIPGTIKFYRWSYNVTFYSDYLVLVDRDVVPESMTY